MLDRFLNIFRIPELRRRVLFTLALLAVYRLGAHIPTPGIDAARLAEFFNSSSGSSLGLFDLFSGGNLRRLTIFALNIMPYITASIVFQLLTVIYEPLAKMQKEGEAGKRKINQWTRYVTVLLAMVQSFFIGYSLSAPGTGMTTMPRGEFLPLCVITLTTGTAFIMWLGEQITDRGIGNGMSLLIFTGIVVGLPNGIKQLADKVRTNAWGGLTPVILVVLIAAMVGVVAFIVYVERAQRQIPVQSARRMEGGRLTQQAQTSYLPLKVNSGGVMPVIFASSILSAPLLLQNLTLWGGTPWRDRPVLGPIFRALGPGEPGYELLYIAAIIFFAYFYISIIFRPDNIADDMRKYGSFIPGVRPGKRTADFINDVLTRLTLVGAVYLIIISLIPTFLISGIHLNHLPWIGSAFDHLPTWVTNGMGLTFYFGGTSLLIVVGVAMDTVQQIEAQLIMRHYEGFAPSAGRIRGRRSW